MATREPDGDDPAVPRVPLWRRLRARPPAPRARPAATDRDARARAALHALDDAIARQLDAVLRHPALLALEGTWRGLHYLLHHATPHPAVSVRLLPCAKADLARDLRRAPTPDRAALSRLLRDAPRGPQDAEPVGVLVADYVWDGSDEDVATLADLATAAEAAPTVCLTGAAPALLGLGDWSALTPESVAAPADPRRWALLRESTASRHLALALPRVLARAPRPEADTPDACCWMNAAWPVATRVAESVALHGWPVWVRGREAGGAVADLPWHAFATGGARSLERIGHDDLLDAALAREGLLLLTQHPHEGPVRTDADEPRAGAWIFSAPTLHRRRPTPDAQGPWAEAEAANAASLPCMLAVTRVGGVLGLIARGGLAAGLAPDLLEARLNAWLAAHGDGAEPAASSATDAPRRRPILRESRAHWRPPEGPDAPGQIVASLRLVLGLGEPERPVRLVLAVPGDT